MKTLLLVDIQNDFLPGGALAVPHGDEVITVANRIMRCFPLVVATQDWHPANHGSFAINHPGRQPGDVVDLGGLSQVLWPAHCIQESWGARFPEALHQERIRRIFRKGMDPGIDSYSAFYDNGRRKATGLGEFLHEVGATSLYIMGLATDYCVKATALDSRFLGFPTAIVVEGCRGVDLKPGDSERALHEMEEQGVRRTTRAELPERDG